MESMGKVHIMKGCTWDKIKPSTPTLPHIISDFYDRSDISENELLQSVYTGQFYGFIQCTLRAPPEVIAHWEKLSFPCIFKHVSVSEESVMEPMLTLIKNKKRKFPLEKQLALVYNAEDYLCSTDLLCFYKETGMDISNVKMAVQYPRFLPLSSFVKNIADKRKAATRLSKTGHESGRIMSKIYKDISNSAWGRLGQGVKVLIVIIIRNICLLLAVSRHF